MHPLLAGKGRVALYLIAWVPLAALLGYLLTVTGSLPMMETDAVLIPLCLFYALVCLTPWYMCKVLPPSPAPSQILKILGNHSVAAIVAALLWVVVAKGLALVLARLYFPQFDQHFSAQIPLLFGIGVLLYLLAVALQYVLLSAETSREAATREQEARTLAREAELKALKAQINPHFLFNSLNSISALATVDGQRAREMCIKLSDFLRSTLSLGDKTSISFREEMALAKAYLDVEQIRFGARLRTAFEADSDCSGCIVPPLFLQPLVENAVKHGVAGMVDGGTIEVTASCEDGWLTVTVENDFDPDAPPATRHGHGLQNVRGRLRALYENQARLDTELAQNRFVVHVELPCKAHA
jgi:two-component system, LytTR family, sensor histidine kinase AlgZ